MILLDTNVLSELLKPRPDAGVVSWMRASSAALAIPTIAIAEMAFGVEKLASGRRRDALLQALQRLTIEFADRLLDFNLKAAWAYGRILAAARRAGRPMSMPDAAIAAIAANGCTLATATPPTLRPPASTSSTHGRAKPPAPAEVPSCYLRWASM